MVGSNGLIFSDNFLVNIPTNIACANLTAELAVINLLSSSTSLVVIYLA